MSSCLSKPECEQPFAKIINLKNLLSHIYLRAHALQLNSFNVNHSVQKKQLTITEFDNKHKTLS